MSSIFRKVQIFDSIVNLHEKHEIMKQKKIPDPKAEDCRAVVPRQPQHCFIAVAATM